METTRRLPISALYSVTLSRRFSLFVMTDHTRMRIIPPQFSALIAQCNGPSLAPGDDVMPKTTSMLFAVIFVMRTSDSSLFT